MVGVEQINGVLLVLLDAIVGLLDAAGDTHKLDAAQQLLGVVEHRQMVAVQVRLALGAVDDQLIDFTDAAADFERGREHGAAHADNTGFADALKDRLGIVHLLLGQGGQIGAGGVLVVVLDHDGHHHVAQGVRPRFNGHNRTGNRGMDRGRHRGRVFADLLPHGNIVALLYQRFIGGAYVLNHRDHDLWGRGDHSHRDFRCLHVIGMHAALECMGHTLHLANSSYCFCYHTTKHNKLSMVRGPKNSENCKIFFQQFPTIFTSKSYSVDLQIEEEAFPLPCIPPRPSVHPMPLTDCHAFSCLFPKIMLDF